MTYQEAITATPCCPEGHVYPPRTTRDVAWIYMGHIVCGICSPAGSGGKRKKRPTVLQALKTRVEDQSQTISQLVAYAQATESRLDALQPIIATLVDWTHALPVWGGEIQEKLSYLRNKIEEQETLRCARPLAEAPRTFGPLPNPSFGYGQLHQPNLGDPNP